MSSVPWIDRVGRGLRRNPIQGTGSLVRCAIALQVAAEEQGQYFRCIDALCI